MFELSKFTVDEESTMLDAMGMLDKNARKILCVTKQKKLLGTITDGDIRRWILKRGSLDAKVKDIANYNPRTLLASRETDSKKVFEYHQVDAIPVVDEHGNLLKIRFRNEFDFQIKKKLDVPVVIMAGGLGTRLYPYTKILPKPLIPVGEIPIVEHIINRFFDQLSNEFHLIVNHKKNMIKSYFSEIHKDYSVKYADEVEPLGTGGGLSLLKGIINTTFILTNCDILIDEDYAKIYEFHKKEKNLITMVCSLKMVRIPYGVIEIGENGEIDNMKEKPEFKFFTNTGMYIVEPEIISALKENEKIHFTTIIQNYKNQGRKVGVYPISDDNWLDMGQLEELEEMRRRLES